MDFLKTFKPSIFYFPAYKTGLFFKSWMNWLQFVGLITRFGEILFTMFRELLPNFPEPTVALGPLGA
jgi:hypothetical protein